MRKLIVFVLAVSLLITAMPAFAARGGRKGADEKAYEHASEEAIFHRVGDWFATRGKSEEEKKAIIAERKAKRAAIRAQKEAEKKKKMIEKEAARKKKMLEREAKKTQKKLDKQMKGLKGKGR
jgi:hypothetical protein